MQHPIHARKFRAGLMFASLCLAGALPAQAQNAAADPQAAEKQQLMSYTPELREKVKALSPQTKQMLKQVSAKHNRPSPTLTLRQVMQEVLADYQNMISGLTADNGAQAADSARRLANHRIPRGGLLPYFGLDKVNDTGLAPLQAFNDQVEGNALKLAEAAEKGDMVKAATYVGDITTGCVACHQVFRGQPGVSPRLLNPAGAAAAK
ncbi:MAG TPA: hypothetical protein VN283_10030 [Thiobacillus sp.]|nr:hypothetical protein [Thiobacillus sp.]